MLNKKGGTQLANNVVGIIIAVMLLAGFVYLVFQMYEIYANAFPEQAKEMVNIIAAKINAIADGESTGFALPGLCVEESGKQGVCQEGYFIAGWGLEDEQRPERCSMKSCICTCGPISGISETINTYDRNTQYQKIIETCQNPRTGFCEMFDEKKLSVLGKADFYAPPPYRDSDKPRVTTTEDVNFIPMKTNLMSFKAEKKNGKIILSTGE